MSSQKGFTLVELLVVILILGILAAAALPKYMDITQDAESAQTEATAAAVSSWGMNNFAAKKLGKSTAKDINNTTDACLTATSSVLAAGTSIFTGDVKLVSGTPVSQDEYKITNTATASDKVCAAGATVKCMIVHKNAASSAPVYVPCTN